jgi:aspartyl-tRNA(Asn)/glutamyl-tRNA(Gln) amidotransferase subunit C
VTQASTVKDVAVLARLTISEHDIENVTAEFNQTLALFDALQSVDTQGVAPMVNPYKANQPLRTDSVRTLVSREGLMKNAPSEEENYFLVPRVID